MEDAPATLPPDTEPPPTRRMKVVVYLSLSLAVALALFLIAITGLRWMVQPTPSSIVVFHSDATFIDSTITLISGTDGNERVVSILPNSDFNTPVFLEPGTYSMSVRRAGKVAFQDQMYVAQGCRYDINITAPVTTRP